MTYPLQREIPTIIDASSFLAWRKRTDDGFWQATDKDGIDWLLKLRGSFYAYRERIASFLMQDLGLQTQSSSYVTLERDSPPLTDNPDAEKYQLAIMMLDKHPHNGTCDTEPVCPFETLNKEFDAASNKIKFLRESNIEHMIDWVKLDILACLCGANEPSERFYTKSHQLYVIDNEQMFSNKPIDPITGTNWFTSGDYNDAMQITLQLCDKLSRIKEEDIQEYSALPEGYEVDAIWDIKRLVRKAIVNAKQYLEIYA